MLVSCAHPGIGKMVQTAEKQRGTDHIRLLIRRTAFLRLEA